MISIHQFIFSYADEVNDIKTLIEYAVVKVPLVNIFQSNF
jgi:hypothetical protein